VGLGGKVVAVENGPGGEGKKGLLWIWRWGWWFRGLLVVRGVANAAGAL
jgi:hypothetical protein